MRETMYVIVKGSACKISEEILYCFAAITNRMIAVFVIVVDDVVADVRVSSKRFMAFYSRKL